MCVVSMITDHYMGRWPLPEPSPTWTLPAIPNNPEPELPSLPDYLDFQELIRKAKAYDELMKQPDCPDPAKEAWMAELEKRMAEKYDLKPKT